VQKLLKAVLLLRLSQGGLHSLDLREIFATHFEALAKDWAHVPQVIAELHFEITVKVLTLSWCLHRHESAGIHCG